MGIITALLLGIGSVLADDTAEPTDRDSVAQTDSSVVTTTDGMLEITDIAAIVNHQRGAIRACYQTELESYSKGVEINLVAQVLIGDRGHLSLFGVDELYSDVQSTKGDRCLAQILSRYRMVGEKAKPALVIASFTFVR